MVQQYFHRITLRFSNQSYEQEFNQKDALKKYKLQLAVVIYFTLMAIIQYFYLGFYINTIIYLVLLYSCVLVGFFKRNFTFYTNLLIMLATQLYYLNLVSDNKDKIFPGQIFIYGQVASSIYLLSSHSYLLDSVVLIACQFLIRIEMDNLPYLNVFEAFQIVVISTTFKHLQQRQERQTFFQKKKAEQWNISVDNIFQNTVVITKYDKVTSMVSVHDCNQQAKKLNVYDDDSFLTFSTSVQIDFTKSKINVILTKDKNTLKDYLLLKHYTFSNLKPDQQTVLLKKTHSEQETSPSEKKKSTQQTTDVSSSVKKQKHDVLYVTYNNPKTPNVAKKLKIKAGMLVFEQPYIILSIQDVSSQTNLSNLKIKSNSNDIIYIKSINEIRDKVVKLIGIVSASKFFSSKSISNMQQTIGNARRVSHEGEGQAFTNAALFGRQKSFNDQRLDTQGSRKADEFLEFPVKNNFLYVQDQVTFQPQSEMHSYQQTHQEENAAQIATEVYEKVPHIQIADFDIIKNSEYKYEDRCKRQNSGNLEENVNKNQAQTQQQLQQFSLNVPIQTQQKAFSNFSKASNLLLIPNTNEQQSPQISQFAQKQQHDTSGFIKISEYRDRDEFSDMGSEQRSQRSYRPSQHQPQTNPNQQYQKITKRTSFNQSYNDGDSLQYIENDDSEIKISNLKLSLSCLLNNTYSLLDYIVLSYEQAHYKKLIIKPNSITLKKLENYLKTLFPNLIVSYTIQDLQDKEIKTDIRRLKYVLISMISSYYYNRKETENPSSPVQRINSLQIIDLPLSLAYNNQTNKAKSPLQRMNTFQLLTDQPETTARQNLQPSKKQLYQQHSFRMSIDYDRQAEIFLNVSLNEQPQFSSVNFSIQQSGSINFPVEGVGIQTMLGMTTKTPPISDTCIPLYGKNSRLSEQELLSQVMSANLSVNGTADQVFRQMEMKNILFNIMRLGPYMPEYDTSLNLFSFDIFDNIDILDIPNPSSLTPNNNANGNLSNQPGAAAINSNHNLNIASLMIKSNINNIISNSTNNPPNTNNNNNNNNLLNSNSNNNNLSPFSYENQSVRSLRKSNFYQHGVNSPNNNSLPVPVVKLPETIRNKKGSHRNKLNSTENVFSKKKHNPLSEAKQQEIDKIKDIQSLDDNYDINSYRTFSSGFDQPIEEHINDSLYQQLPEFHWQYQQPNFAQYQM